VANLKISLCSVKYRELFDCTIKHRQFSCNLLAEGV
jgi:hypothetical protein